MQAPQAARASELATEPHEENASYIANWLEILKNDTRFIFKASADAQRAADFLCAFSGAAPLMPTQPRDLYDLWFLTTRAGIDIGDLNEAIAEKLRFRKKEIPGLEDRIIAKDARLKTLWNSRLGHQMETLPEFDEVFRAVGRELRRSNFPE